MKKSLIIGLASLVSAIASFGQGTIILDNGIGSAGPYVTYGNAGIPANGASGASGSIGGLVQGGWTMGLYYALGNVTGSVASDPTGWADVSTLGGNLILGTGTGSTASFAASFEPGAATAGFAFIVPGTSADGGDTITVILTVYDTAAGSYANAPWRGHSKAFTMPTGQSDTQLPIPIVGNYMSAFSVFSVPEPSTFTLAGLSSLAVLLFRNRGKKFV